MYTHINYIKYKSYIHMNNKYIYMHINVCVIYHVLTQTHTYMCIYRERDLYIIYIYGWPILGTERALTKTQLEPV